MAECQGEETMAGEVKVNTNKFAGICDDEDSEQELVERTARL